jgi:dihydroorotase
MDLSRRNFIKLSSSAAAAGVALTSQAPPAEAAPTMLAQAGPMPRGFNPADPALKFDLVIAGGEVLDPGQKLRARRDVGIKNGQIAALAPSIPADRSVQRIDATGKLVTPGLVDLHTHCYPHISAFGLPFDEFTPITATTTAVSAGDAGWNTFGGFRHWAAPQSHTRLFAFVHISSIGLAGGAPVGELLNMNYADADACAKIVAENADIVLGVKVRVSDYTVGTAGANGIEALRRAIKAAEGAGKSFPVMLHIGGSPGSLPDLLDMLRPGDVLTHAFTGAGNNVVQSGNLLAAALRAKQRGVVIDVGHGGGSFDFTIADPAIQQGLVPDTISSDLHSYSINSPGYPTLPWVMSKFLSLGLSLEDVVEKTTIAPARVIGRVAGLGTLQVGAPADVAVFELADGPVEFVDTMKHARKGTKKLVPVYTVRGGASAGRPPVPSPYVF